MSAIYPITPSSAMGEWTDQWATEGRLNLWGRPLILLPSNPTGQSEAVPVEVIPWTGGRALVSAGSPFDPVAHEGREIRVGQCNYAWKVVALSRC